MDALKGRVLVLTGATSGVGLETARRAARRGGRLVLVARHEQALHEVAAEVREAGGEALPVVADVSDARAMERVAEAAVEAFGAIDVWINNATVGLLGRLLDTPIEEERRVFEVNLWGMVHGTRAALRAMGDRGGVLIQVASGLAHRPMPPLSTWSAAQHAVKAWTDALRMELEDAGRPIRVTLIKPAALDSPFIERSRRHLPDTGLLPLFVYAPEVVADAILTSATRPGRDVVVGGLGVLSLMWLEKLAPRLLDHLMAWNLRRLPPATPPPGPDALWAADGVEGHVHGTADRWVRRHSYYAPLALHPGRIAAVGALVTLGLLGWWARGTSRNPSPARLS